MPKDIINKWIQETYNGSYRFIKHKNLEQLIGKDQINIILRATEEFSSDPLSRRVFCFMHDINQHPKCICGKKTKFNTSTQQFQIYCSNKCRIQDIQSIQEKKKQTNLERYGVSNVLNSAQSKASLIRKYGVDNYFKSTEYQDRVRSGDILRGTNIEKQRESRHNSTFIKLRNGVCGATIQCSRDQFKGVGYDYSYQFKCDACNHLYSSWYMNGLIKPCPSCNKLSDCEAFIKDTLDNLGITYEYRNRIILDGLEIDFYIPSLKLGIEVHGLYWHSEANNTHKNYHISKLQTALDKNIQLVQIFDDEIRNTPDIVRSRIASICGVSKDRHYARKLQIKHVSSSDAREFFSINHLQGSCASSIRIGLYNEDNLLMCMSFAKLRPSLGYKCIDGSYELTRVASKLDTSVIGGFSKILKHFIAKYKPAKLISYCDRRWSEGKSYELNGMTLIRNTAPNYWYTKDFKQRLHRWRYRKSELGKILEHFDNTLSERENMINHKYSRVWDCGHKLYCRSFHT